MECGVDSSGLIYEHLASFLFPKKGRKFLDTFCDYCLLKYDRDVRSCYTVSNRENAMVFIINKSFSSLYLFGHKVIY
jgi:hypothetical protein